MLAILIVLKCNESYLHLLFIQPKTGNGFQIDSRLSKKWRRLSGKLILELPQPLESKYSKPKTALLSAKLENAVCVCCCDNGTVDVFIRLLCHTRWTNSNIPAFFVVLTFIWNLYTHLQLIQVQLSQDYSSTKLSLRKQIHKAVADE